jgi:D-alanine-D-alanine ligase
MTIDREAQWRAWQPHVWLFVPYYDKGGVLESPEYDLPSFRDEVRGWFDAIGLTWQWVPVTLNNALATIEAFQAAHRDSHGVVFNLCDGNELDGSPGVSVVRALEEARVPFTGSASAFYDLTTYKTPMKARLIAHGVPTAPFVRLAELPADLARIEREVGFPAFLKPEVSAGSGGIALTSRVTSRDEAEARIKYLMSGEDGPFYRTSGLFVERFIEGPEFTVLVVADRSAPRGVRAYPPAERIFHSGLPSHERFLSYDRYWSLYTEESRPPPGEPFYRYGPAASAHAQALADLAERAFVAVDGTGYGRVDIRLDMHTGEFRVLEVNSNCGLSGDRETSVGELLFLAGVPVQDLLMQILRDAFDRHAEPSSVEAGFSRPPSDAPPSGLSV